MLIKQRVGRCIDCTPADGDKPLMAKRCTNRPNFHYQKHQQAKYQKKSNERKTAKTALTSKANNGLTLGKWFNEQINQMPRHCENCAEYLNPYAPWSARSYVAHIVPKRHFISVMVHPLNRLFLCIDCHAKFDNSLSREIVEMNCWPLAIERFNAFKIEIASNEIHKLQPCFEAIY